MSLLGLLVFVVILGLFYWALTTLAETFNLPAQIVTLITVALVIFAVLYLLSEFGALAGGPVLRVR